MGEIVNVKKIVDEKKEELKKQVKNLKKKKVYPKLAVILANAEEASKIYINKKRKMCEEIGIEAVEYIFDEEVTNEQLIDLIDRLNEDANIDGILVQLPLFKHLDENKIIEKISPDKDADGFHPTNLGKIMIGTTDIVPATPKGILSILDSLDMKDLSGLNAVVVGRSVIVGKPIASLLLNRNATVTICHSKTKDLKEYTKKADVLVVATGVYHLVTKDMVKKDAVVIDVGINRKDGKVAGDVDTENVAKKAKYVTPVPGGVGITTVASLMENVVYIASKKIKE